MKSQSTSDGLTPFYPCESIYGVPALARALGITQIRLERVALMANGLYRLAKEETKQDGSKRQTYDALPLLKAIQNRIKDRILVRVYCPPYLNGSLKGRSTRTNAQPHIGPKILFEEDIENFFPSIGLEVIKRMWTGLFGFSDDVATLLTLLTIKDQGIPQGAVTSSYLANFAFWAHEPGLVRRLARRGLVYTRFVDDISVSGKERIAPEEKSYVISQIYGMLSRHRVAAKASKHKISSARERMTATKLVINERVSLPREKRRNLRAAVHKLEQQVTFGEHSEHLLKAINSVAVKVGQLKAYHLDESIKLKKRLDIVRSRIPCTDLPSDEKTHLAQSTPTLGPSPISPPWD